MAPAGPSEGADPIKSAGRIAFEGVHRAERWIVVGLQTLGVLAYNGIIALPFALVLLLVVETVDGRVPLDTAISLAVAGSFALWPSLLLLSIAIKWLVIGRYKPGCYPVWSLYYLRWWVATRFQALSWSEMFSGSPLMSLYYRAMGAKVGRNVIISTPICAAFDLVEIGMGQASAVRPTCSAIACRMAC
ncbi:MAG: hypothetical protein HC774_07745 [Sphingomonadales bacterium]|nr:hypothetical protein [Sphingomonadales bacterium]